VKIEYAVPCRALETLTDGTLLLIGVETNAFRVRQFPSELRATVLLCVSETHLAAQAGQATDFSLSILNPAMEPCASPLTISVKAPVHPDLPDGWASRSLVPMAFKFQAESEGRLLNRNQDRNGFA
jgi:hypothetical protein